MKSSIIDDLRIDINGIRTKHNVSSMCRMGRYINAHMGDKYLPIHAQIAHALVDEYKRTHDDAIKTHMRRYIRAYMNSAFTDDVTIALTKQLQHLYLLMLFVYYAISTNINTTMKEYKNIRRNIYKMTI